jgi:hypothetical protein
MTDFRVTVNGFIERSMNNNKDTNFILRYCSANIPETFGMSSIVMYSSFDHKGLH